MSDEFVVPPPASATVYHDHRVVLFTPDGTALIRRAGFAPAMNNHDKRWTLMPCGKPHGGKKGGGRKK